MIPQSDEYVLTADDVLYCTYDKAGRSFEKKLGQKEPSYVSIETQAESLITPSSSYYWAE